MQNQLKVIDKKVKTYIIFDRVHKTKVEVLKFMGKTLYLECYSGISGDMTVGALLDLGADKAVLDRVLQSLPVSGFQIKTGKVVKSGIEACDFDVMLDKDHENHDHDMKYLHGHNENTEGESEIHTHEHVIADHACAHERETAHCHHHHEHRGVKEIAHIIEHSAMTDNAKKIALRIFEILAKAESKAHDVPVEQVHFHEVGAVDSIVDIVSVAAVSPAGHGLAEFFIIKDIYELVAGIVAALIGMNDRFRLEGDSMIFHQFVDGFQDEIHFQRWTEHVRQYLLGKGIQDSR